jgi:hypothetical protein
MRILLAGNESYAVLSGFARDETSIMTNKANPKPSAGSAIGPERHIAMEGRPARSPRDCILARRSCGIARCRRGMP